MVRGWIAVALLAASPPVYAEPKPPDPPPSLSDEAMASGRTLNGHPFLPMASVAQPFVTTEFQSLMGVGHATFEANGGPAPFDVSLGFLTTAVAAQIGFADLVAVRLGVTGNILTGANEDSAFQFGATAGPDFSAGASVRLLRLDFAQAAVGLNVERGTTWQVSPATLLSGVQLNPDTGELTYDRRAAYVQTDTLGFEPGVSIALAPHPVVGVVLSGGLAISHQEVKRQEALNGTAFVGGAGLSLNFQPLGAPLGAVAAVLRDFGSDSTDAATTLEFGLFPASFSHFSFGLEASLYTEELPPVDGGSESIGSIKALSGQAVLLYAR